MKIIFIVWICFFFQNCHAVENKPPLIIDKFIKSYMNEYEIPGLVMAYFDGEKGEFFSYGYADMEKSIPVTPDTIFELASITKVFTSTALALHVIKGDMSLKDPITKYLPFNKMGSINQITLLNLATHTSSLPRALSSTNEMNEFLQEWEPESQIGTKYLYSNLGYGILGFALEKVEGRSYYDVIFNNILLPLNMHSTFVKTTQKFDQRYAQGYTEDGDLAPRRGNLFPGSGALRSSARDMLQFLKANLELTGPEKLIKAMQLAQQPFYKVSGKLTMGLGWQRIHLKGVLCQPRPIVSLPETL